MSKYDDILARLKDAEGPRYALDEAVGEVAGLSLTSLRRVVFPPYTASVDAALKLADHLTDDINVKIVMLAAIAQAVRDDVWGRRCIYALIALFASLQAREVEHG